MQKKPTIPSARSARPLGGGSGKSAIVPARGGGRGATPNKETLTTPPFAPGYSKLGRLGSGGFGEVWAARRNSDGAEVAVKQIAKSNVAGEQAAMREVAMARRLYDVDMDGSERPEVKDDAADGGGATGGGGGGGSMGSGGAAAVRCIARLLCATQSRADRWLVFENGGTALSELAFEIKGQFHQGERIYCIRQRTFYNTLRAHPALLAQLLGDVASVVAYVTEQGIAHCDLNPANICCAFAPFSAASDDDCGGPTGSSSGGRFPSGRLQTRVIDFGSAVDTRTASARLATNDEKNKVAGSAASGAASSGVTVCGTPEYSAPEMLDALASGEDCGAVLCAREGACDAWSLGACFLELALGFPLWFGYKSRVDRGDATSLAPPGSRGVISSVRGGGGGYAGSSGYGGTNTRAARPAKTASGGDASGGGWAPRGGAFACVGRGPADVRARQLRVCADLPAALARGSGRGVAARQTAPCPHDWYRARADREEQQEAAPDARRPLRRHARAGGGCQSQESRRL